MVVISPEIEVVTVDAGRVMVVTTPGRVIVVTMSTVMIETCVTVVTWPGRVVVVTLLKISKLASPDSEKNKVKGGAYVPLTTRHYN